MVEHNKEQYHLASDILNLYLGDVFNVITLVVGIGTSSNIPASQFNSNIAHMHYFVIVRLIMF